MRTIMEEKITVCIRDGNGNRNTVEFDNRAELLAWARDDITEKDEILFVSQGGVCLYSGLQSTHMLSVDCLTGFFG